MHKSSLEWMIMVIFMPLNVIKKKLPIWLPSNTNSGLWKFFNMKIWSDCMMSAKMLSIKSKISQLQVVSPSFWNMLVEVNYLTLLLKLGSFLKKLPEHISIRWWMGFIICIQRAMLTGILNHKIFFWVEILFWSWLILDFLAFSKEKIILMYSTLNWELKAIWLLKFQQKITMVQKQTFLQLELYCLSCMLVILHLKKQQLMILTINLSKIKILQLSGKLILGEDHQIFSVIILRTFLRKWLPITQTRDHRWLKLPSTHGSIVKSALKIKLEISSS